MTEQYERYQEQPDQIPNDYKVRKVANNFQHVFSKCHKSRWSYHSIEEWYYAAKLELDFTVERFTPQPTQYGAHGNRYIPDFFFLKTDGTRFVVEVKPKKNVAKFESKYKPAMEAKARCENFKFLIIENEEIRAGAQLSKNAIYISRVLNGSSGLITDEEESQITRMLLVHGNCQYTDIIAKDNRVEKRLIEVALWRLVHRGRVAMNLRDQPISYDSSIRLKS